MPTPHNPQPNANAAPQPDGMPQTGAPFDIEAPVPAANTGPNAYEATSVNPITPRPMGSTEVQRALPPEHLPGPRPVPAAETHKGLKRTIAGTLGAIVVAGITLVGLASTHREGPDSSAALRDRPTAEAAPSPAYTSTTLAPTTTAALERAVPQVTSPTTAAQRPSGTVAAETSTTKAAQQAPSVTPESKPNQNLLSADERAEIEATGFSVGLKNEKLVKLSAFESSNAEIVLVGVGDATLSPEQLKEFKTDIAIAEAVAARQSPFTVNLQLGAGPESNRDISYTAMPAKAGKRYFLIAGADKSLASLAQPVKSVLSPNEFTASTSTTNVSMVRLQPGQNIGGLDATSQSLATAVFHSSTSFKINQSSVDMLDKDLPAGLDASNVPGYDVKNPNYSYLKTLLREIGREDYSNSWSFGQTSARAGKGLYTNVNAIPYGRYVATAKSMQFGVSANGNDAYEKLHAFFFPVEQADYAMLGQS